MRSLLLSMLALSGLVVLWSLAAVKAMEEVVAMQEAAEIEMFGRQGAICAKARPDGSDANTAIARTR
jgi:hypothetical protein